MFRISSYRSPPQAAIRLRNRQKQTPRKKPNLSIRRARLQWHQVINESDHEARGVSHRFTRSTRVMRNFLAIPRCAFKSLFALIAARDPILAEIRVSAASTRTFKDHQSRKQWSSIASRLGLTSHPLPEETWRRPTGTYGVAFAGNHQEIGSGFLGPTNSVEVRER